MTSERHSVGTQLSFALYGASNRIVRLHQPFLEPLGLTYPQYPGHARPLEARPCRRRPRLQLDMDTGR